MPSIKPSLFANIKRNVFLSTVLILVLFLALILFDPSGFEALTKHLNQWIIDSFSWFYVLSVALFLILLIFIALSDMGKIKHGPDHSLPEYSSVSWFAMLFTAGMGIGLMFFGVAEPVMHYVNPPTGDGQTVDAPPTKLNPRMVNTGVWRMTLAMSNRTKTPKPQTNTRKDKLWPLNSAKISIINCNSSNHAEGSRRKPFQNSTNTCICSLLFLNPSLIGSCSRFLNLA